MFVFRARLTVVLMGLLAVVALTGCRQNPTPPTITASAITEPTHSDLPTTVPDAALSVTDINWYQGDVSWTVAGLVTNNTTQAYNGVTLAIVLLDDEGNTRPAGTAYLLVDAIAPGESMPFVWSGDGMLPAHARVAAEVVGKDPANLARAVLDVENAHLVRAADGTVLLTGELVNHTAQPVLLSNLAAAVFAADGHILSAAYGEADLTHYAPGARGPFQIAINTTPGLAAEIHDFRIFPDAQTDDARQP